MQKHYSIKNIDNVSAQELLGKGCIHSGFLRKKSGKTFTKWHRKFAILTKNRVYIFESETAKIPKSIFGLLGYKALCRYSSKSNDVPWAFVLVPAYTNLSHKKFACVSDQERAQWMLAFKSSMCMANSVDIPLTLPSLGDAVIVTESLYECLEEPVFNSEDDNVDLREISAAERRRRWRDERNDMSSSSCSTDVRNSDTSESSEASSKRNSDISQSSEVSPMRISDISQSSEASAMQITDLCQSIGQCVSYLSDFSDLSDQRISSISQTTDTSTEVPEDDELNEPIYCEPDPIIYFEESLPPPIPDTPVPRLDPNADYVNLRSDFGGYITPIDVIKMSKSLIELCLIKDTSKTRTEIRADLLAKPVGTYLIRKSQTSEHDVLSYLIRAGDVRQFKIWENEEEHVSLDRISFFSSVEELLKNYTHETPLPFAVPGDKKHYLQQGFHSV